MSRGVAFGHFPAPKPQKQTHSRAGTADDIIGQDWVLGLRV